MSIFLYRFNYVYQGQKKIKKKMIRLQDISIKMYKFKFISLFLNINTEIYYINCK